MVVHDDEVTVEVADATVTVTLRGEIDATLAERLSDVASRADLAGRPVVVDLAAVRFMDSTAIGFLLRLRSVAAGRVRVVNAGAFPRHLLAVAGVERLFDVVGTGATTDG
ncbi:anti-sigma-factor antagonist [Cellulomonas flavigena DSM 20109]|uniref:Anti-sigma-factor antagonist n=1 Tax=Cellulomonas flavigena (strain ATCC 482 / DSM 20109 / BCRC 11376 / JCM 18109 / NBRC 3775 / NCIMB 8073 / NRS 134) TaxID=446466 RepID=D5ULX9_CELFN|nr:STAS domain-containing protein [Cellulomonas flavigena]ADG76085.1 anti-sigma-factor antagonist [Cellulomonas flavigena DSM 20109]